MPADDYKRVLAPGGAIYLTTVGYGTGALLGRGINACARCTGWTSWASRRRCGCSMSRTLAPSSWKAIWKNSLFAQHAETINAGIERLYAGLKPPALHRYALTR